MTVSAATCGTSSGNAAYGSPTSLLLKPEGWILAPKLREEGQAGHPPSLGMTSPPSGSLMGNLESTYSVLPHVFYRGGN